jgi:hypothetical protein
MLPPAASSIPTSANDASCQVVFVR